MAYSRCGCCYGRRADRAGFAPSVFSIMPEPARFYRETLLEELPGYISTTITLIPVEESPRKPFWRAFSG